MEFHVFVEPQLGASTADQIRIATTAEELGFDGFFRSDHLLTMGEHDGLPGPTDSWVTLAAIAMATSRIRLGTLVSSATFRHPSMLAMQVAQVDELSGGRAELGLGTGWFEAEHTAYGIPFPAKRFGPFEEQLEIITGLWNTPIGSTYSFAGEHYTLRDAPALPKPTQSHVPIIVGGSGPARTPAIAARFANEYNGFRAPAEELLTRFARLDAACEAIGRDPASIVRSLALTTVVGGTDAEIATRAAAARRGVDELRTSGLAGTAAEAVDTVAGLAELGIGRFYFQLMDLRDLDQVAFIAQDVLPHVR
jgi:F420-dependent oxidoreductase-like protein